MTVGDVIRSVARSTVAGVTGTEPAAIADAPDGVHQHRTHIRRLRSVLAALRGYLDEAAADRLRVQFAEWGGQLGVVRDIEVRADVAAAAIEELGIDDADLARRLVDVEREAYTRAHARLVDLYEAPRSTARREALTAFGAAPPLTAEADADADALEKVLRHEARRVRRAAKRSDGSIESLHEVRKAGRRLRYTAEALHVAAPDLFGDAFVELAEAGEGVHDALGDHRDELIFIERLELARAQAGRAAEHVEHYDALIARSEARAKAGLAGLDDALARVKEAVAAL